MTKNPNDSEMDTFPTQEHGWDGNLGSVPWLKSTLERQRKMTQKPAHSAISTWIDSKTIAFKAETAPGKVQSHLRGLNDITAGFHPGELTLLVSRPGQGKTSFMTDLAICNPNSYFFSVEMTSKSLIGRIISNIAQVNLHSYRNGIPIPPKIQARLDRADEKRKNLSLFVDDSPILNTKIFNEKLEAVQPDFVLVDYLQLIASIKDTDGQPQSVEDICRCLREIAKIRQIPVVVACQMNREQEKRDNPIPRLSDLYWGGEQTADVIMFLYRPSSFAVNADQNFDDGEAHVIVAKNRNGPTGDVKCCFIREWTSFRDIGILESDI